jgi:polyisoprenoid-binding protein YceI
MKTKLLSALLLLSFSPLSFGDTYEIDPVHSRVGFKIRHLMISNVIGSFGDFQGKIEFDPKTIEKSSTAAEIKIASITTANTKRDDHLRGDDFFSSQKFPSMRFISKKVTKKDDQNFEVEGELTIRDVTKLVTLATTYTGSITDFAGDQKVGFTATTTINRKDFGLTWNKVLEAGGVAVGDNVQIDIELEAAKKKA